MILLFLYYFIFPALALYGCNRYSWLNSIGSVVLCYAGGIAIASFMPLLTDGSVNITADGSLQSTLMSVCVVFALPLMLFSTNIKHWIKLGPTTLLSMTSSVFSIVFMSFMAGIFLNNHIDEIWKSVGLISALYLGGTPNLAAAKEALNVDTNLFLQINAYDTVLTFGYIIFIVTFAQRLLHTFLPKFNYSQVTNSEAEDTPETLEDIKLYAQLLRLTVWKKLPIAIFSSAAIVLISVGSSKLIFGDENMALVMVMITVLAVAASFIERIRSVPNTFELGMYVVLVFCVVVGSLVTGELFQSVNIPIMIFMLIVIFGALSIHLLIAKWLKIDADTTIITSVAAICSPPFIPMVVVALKNKDMLLSGITAGVLGYVLGNIASIGVAYLFKALIG